MLRISCMFLCFFALSTVQSSPFDLTEAYVDSFAKGLEDLRKISEEYEYKQEEYNVPEKSEMQQSSADAKEYDFIVVGSGTSGSVLANRLTEVPEWKVLVLEAGLPETAFTQVPAVQKLLQTTPYDWRFHTVPQNHSCLGMEEHSCSVPAAKAFGGGSATNDMLYIRGNPKDYDAWADLGLEGWCWSDVLPYFKKIEDAHLVEFDRKHHSLGGPVHLEPFQHATDLGRHILEAAHQLNLPTAVDYNGKAQLGVGVPQAVTERGTRRSAAQAYLSPAAGRRNLEVAPSSRVVRIRVGPHTGAVEGVEYVRDGRLHVARAAKEVVVAAGAVNTAQLLMLSGIGPKEELEALHINPVADLRVGKNMRDQVSFIGLNFLMNKTEAIGKLSEKHAAIIEYLKNGKGPLTTPGIEAIGFIKTEASKEKLDRPDISLVVIKDDQPHRSLRIKKEIHDAVWTPREDYDGFTVRVNLLHPMSTGSVSLRDENPMHHPLIHPNSLTDPDDRDLESLLAGVHQVLGLAQTEVLRGLGVHLDPRKVPGCDGEGDHYWRCAIRHVSTNLGQVSGTAKMGKEGDKDAVVDEKLRVRGVHKLRLADASVIPVTMSGSLMAPVIMIGEKAADLVKQEWK